MKILIKLDVIERVTTFNSLAQKCADEVEVGQDSWTVDGKSLMGLFSLNLSENVIVTFNGNVDGNLIYDLNGNGFEFEILNA